MISRQAEAVPLARGQQADAEHAADHGGGDIAVVNASVSPGEIKRDPGGATGPLAGHVLGTGSLGGAALGAAIGGIVRGPDSGVAGQPSPGGASRPAAAPAHPTAIASTTTYGAALNYGNNYKHTFVSSTGHLADINHVRVGERVTVARNDFGFRWRGVAMGAISARVNNAGQWGDEIGTPAAVVHPQMASVRNLPAVLDTPQDLYWQDASGRWNHFASIGITFTVQQAAAGGMEAVTVDNGVPFVEPFTGPGPGAGTPGRGGPP